MSTNLHHKFFHYYQKKMDSMNKHATLDLFFTLLDSNDILDDEKKTLIRKHNNVFLQIGKCMFHFHIYSISLSQEPFLHILTIDPQNFTPMYQYHPSFYSLKMINTTTLYDFQKIIKELKKLRDIL